jgi:hypothetical protein
MMRWWRFWRDAKRSKAGGESVARPVQVTVYKNAECSLCDRLIRDLASLRSEIPFELEVVPVEQAGALAPFVKENAPVVAVAGKVRLWGRIEMSWLKRAVQAASHAAKAQP